MDINRAKEIVSALAEGIDPTTGELLPENSVYNKGDIVRALYAVLDACSDKKRQTKKTNKKEPDHYDTALYERLKKLRNKIAVERDLLPFQVFPNLPLKHMASQKPTTKEDLLKVYGVGKYTMRQYGLAFLAEIKDYLEKIE